MYRKGWREGGPAFFPYQKGPLCVRGTSLAGEKFNKRRFGGSDSKHVFGWLCAE